MALNVFNLVLKRYWKWFFNTESWRTNISY